MSLTAAGVLFGILGLLMGWGLGFFFGSRQSISHPEFREIWDQGFNYAIEAATTCLDDFSRCADNPKETIRHAALLRKLKVATSAEAEKSKEGKTDGN